MKRIKFTLKDSKYIFLSGIVEKVTFFLFFLTITRLNTPEEYGNFAIINSFFSMLIPFFDLGIKYHLQREASNSNDNLQDLVDVVISLKFVCFFIFILVGIIYLNIFSKLNIFYVISYGMLIYLLNLILSINQLLYGLKKYDVTFYSLFVVRFVLITFFILNIFLFKIGNLVFLNNIFMLITIFQLLLLYFPLSKQKIKLRIRFSSLNNYLKLVRESYLLGISLVFVYIYDKIDIQILNFYIPKQEIAFYSIAYSFFKLPQIIASSILTPAFTNFSRDYKDHKIDLHKIQETSILLLGIALSIILFYFLFANKFISIIYGTNYAISAYYLKIISIGIIFYFFNNFTGVFLNAYRYEKITVKSTIYALNINILFNIIYIISTKNIYGAIYSSILTELFILLYQLYKAYQIIKNVRMSLCTT